MSKSVDLSASAHAAMNTFPALLADGDTLEKIVFWDVGTGNCNTLYGPGDTPLVYFDFGGNKGTGAKTYPYKSKPGIADPRPLAAFPKNANNAKLVMSHWDEDHVYSLNAQPDMAQCAWLGPREDLAPKTVKLAAKIGKKLRIWNSTTDHPRVVYESKKGFRIILVRCRGNPLNVPSKQDERNDTGISMIVEAETPTRAAAAVKAIEEHVKAHGTDSAGAVLAGAAVAGADVYREAVLAAAQRAADAYPANASHVSLAAQAALSGQAVKAATLAIFAAVEAAAASQSVSDLVLAAALAASDIVEPETAKVLRAMATALGADATAVVVAARPQLPGYEVSVADALMAAAAVETAGGTSLNAFNAAVTAAGVNHSQPNVKAVLDAMTLAGTGGGDVHAVVAAGIAAANGALPLHITVAALASARGSTDAGTALAAALKVAIDAMTPLYPMFGRAMIAAGTAITTGADVTATAGAMAATLDAATGAVRHADAPAVLVKMKWRQLQASPTNAAVEAAGEAPKGGEYYAHRVIKAVRAKIKALGATDDPAGVVQAGVAMLDGVPQVWKTHVLLTGDACFQALPPAVLLNTEWDVLLAYHHGSRDNFVEEPGKKAGNCHVGPLPVLEGISTIVYSAGRRVSGAYVHKHPELPAIQKYQAAGWTVELHTHEWPPVAWNARGNRICKLPYAP